MVREISTSYTFVKAFLCQTSSQFTLLVSASMLFMPFRFVVPLFGFPLKFVVKIVCPFVNLFFMPQWCLTFCLWLFCIEWKYTGVSAYWESGEFKRTMWQEVRSRQASEFLNFHFCCRRDSHLDWEYIPLDQPLMSPTPAVGYFENPFKLGVKVETVFIFRLKFTIVLKHPCHSQWFSHKE